MPQLGQTQSHAHPPPLLLNSLNRPLDKRVPQTHPTHPRQQRLQTPRELLGRREPELREEDVRGAGAGDAEDGVAGRAERVRGRGEGGEDRACGGEAFAA